MVEIKLRVSVCLLYIYMSWQMYLTESDTLGGVFWKSWPDLRRFRAIWLDAWSCALCGAGQQHVTVRPSCSGREKHRQVSGQADNSPAPEAFGLTPQSKYICICLEIFWRGGSCLEKSAIDLQAGETTNAPWCYGWANKCAEVCGFSVTASTAEAVPATN